MKIEKNYLLIFDHEIDDPFDLLHFDDMISYY